MKPELQACVERIAASLRGRLGCIVCGAGGDIWAAHRQDEQFPAASVIKVPILLALAAGVDAGRHRWDEVTPSHPAGTAGGGGVIQFLSPLPYTLRDLATLMIIVSDNRATNRLIDLVGRDRINAYISSAGCRGTVLARRMMDFAARAQGRENATTPKDMADLFLRLLRGELATPATTAVLMDMLKAQQVRDRLPAWLPDGVAAAHKTGNFPGVMNDAGILFLPAGPVAASVFTSDLAADAEGRLAIQEIGRAIVETAKALPRDAAQVQADPSP
jgi:beta-lactamase class A